MMAKAKTAFVCNDCGADYTKWQGQCTECKAWNTLSEVRLAGKSNVHREPKFTGYAGASANEIKRLDEIELDDIPRIHSGFSELDRVLGGGFVAGSAVLIGGHPGAGKSTLLLQILCKLCETLPCLYATGEESLQQIALRAQRLQLPTDKLQLLAETNVEAIIAAAQNAQPRILVVDSIQVMYLADITSAPGSVSQVRESAALLTRFAKQTNTVLVMVGHVTKEGSLAGPKVLEHMIDCSIMLDSTDDSRYRTLRSSKNRFGAINELGVFAMLETGLKEVSNPSAIFLSRARDVAAGSVVMVMWEGTRPLLVELQALVDDSHLGHPRRVAVGLDHNRLAMLLAVIHRHGGLMLGDQDVFLNIVGGVKTAETAVDLATVLAIVSSFKNQPLPDELVTFGEVGLSGEIRPVPSGQERLREAAKHGFTRAIVPAANAPREEIKGMTVVAAHTLQQALDAAFSQ
jgi:DNA repair protein RadA/Sms